MILAGEAPLKVGQITALIKDPAMTGFVQGRHALLSFDQTRRSSMSRRAKTDDMDVPVGGAFEVVNLVDDDNSGPVRVFPHCLASPQRGFLVGPSGEREKHVRVVLVVNEDDPACG